jgi:hypothetical protein
MNTRGSEYGFVSSASASFQERSLAGVTHVSIASTAYYITIARSGSELRSLVTSAAMVGGV